MKVEIKRLVVLSVISIICLVFFFYKYISTHEISDEVKIDVLHTDTYYVEVLHLPDLMHSDKPVHFNVEDNEVTDFQMEGECRDLYLKIDARKGREEYKNLNILNKDVNMYYEETNNGYIYYVKYRGYEYKLECIHNDKEYIKEWIQEVIDVNYWI